MVARRILFLLLLVASTNVVVFALEYFVYTPFRVPSSSMRPGLHAGDRIAVDHTVTLDELRREDLVVFAVGPDTEPGDDFPEPGDRGSRLLVKRVIGLPGETVEAAHGEVAVNDALRLDDRRYVLDREVALQFPVVRVGRDEIFVLGDNRAHSRDSRDFGPVPESAILGRVTFRYWPPQRVKLF